jgi:hypothetical protein
VNVPRSISANFSVSSVAVEPIIHRETRRPHCIHTVGFTHGYDVASWKLYEVAWGITLVSPEKSEMRVGNTYLVEKSNSTHYIADNMHMVHDARALR